jgi:hypothetical protein
MNEFFLIVNRYNPPRQLKLNVRLGSMNVGIVSMPFYRSIKRGIYKGGMRQKGSTETA